MYYWIAAIWKGYVNRKICVMSYDVQFTNRINKNILYDEL